MSYNTDQVLGSTNLFSLNQKFLHNTDHPDLNPCITLLSVYTIPAIWFAFHITVSDFSGTCPASDDIIAYTCDISALPHELYSYVHNCMWLKCNIQFSVIAVFQICIFTPVTFLCSALSSLLVQPVSSLLLTPPLWHRQPISLVSSIPSPLL
jgi:hypothetical protein